MSATPEHDASASRQDSTTLLQRLWRIPLAESHFYGLCALAFLVGLTRSCIAILRHPQAGNFLDWKLTQFYVNYFDFGFVKRGLMGTLFFPIVKTIGPNVAMAKLVIVLLDTGLFALLMATLARKLLPIFNRNAPEQAALRWLLILSPVGVMQYSFDIGRYDHLNYALAGAALWLTLNDRAALAGALAAAGVLVHEAMAVYALPLLAATCLALQQGRGAKMTVIASELAKLLGPAVLLSGWFACQGADANIGQTLPASLAEGAGAWNRGLFQFNDSLGAGQIGLIGFYAIAPGALLLSLYRANDRKLDCIYLATLPPVALFAMGVDYARWTEILFLANLAALFVNCRLGHLSYIPKQTTLRALYLSYLLPLGPIGVTRALPYLDSLTRGPIASALGLSTH